MKLFLFLILFLPISLIGQKDSLNKFDVHGKKTGYWIEYLDGRLRKTKPEKAVYKILQYFFNGYRAYQWAKIPKSYQIEFEKRNKCDFLDGRIKGFEKEGYSYFFMDFERGLLKNVVIYNMFNSKRDTTEILKGNYTKTYGDEIGSGYLEEYKKKTGYFFLVRKGWWRRNSKGRYRQIMKVIKQ